MDEFDTIESAIITSTDLSDMFIRFIFNTFFVWLIIQWLYYPKSRRKEFYFTFALISVSIFFLIYLLGSIKIKVGFALGLFAIFGIIRYRTESMSVREMTYLFVIIAVSVINALAISLNYLELTAVNFIFLATIFFGEKMPCVNYYSEKMVRYDRIDLITPDKREQLIADLRTRLGVNVHDVEVGAVDFLRDSAMLKVYYKEQVHTSHLINHTFSLPKNDN